VVRKEDPLMPTVVIRIDLPPRGVLEVTGQGSNPTDDEMREEKQYRQEFLDAVTPVLASLPDRPPRRAGNVSRVELLGTNVWSQNHHYLLLIDVDIGDPRIDWASFLPPGAEVSTVGAYTPLRHWPEDAAE
jgi:hypothetical protein